MSKNMLTVKVEQIRQLVWVRDLNDCFIVFNKNIKPLLNNIIKTQ